MQSTKAVPQERPLQLAARIERIAPSATLAVMNEAERYKARGLDVVDFGPGEPDFPTPEHIKRAAIRAIEEDRTKYTAVAGIAPLRQAICDWHAREFGSSYEPGECVATTGGKHAIFQAVSVLINSGDEVIVPTPCWVSFPDIVKYAGGAPVLVATGAADGFRLRAESVEAAVTPRTRLVIVNSPCNPTGAVIPAAEFERILGVCRRRGLWLLSDECYSHFTYGEAKPYSIAGAGGSKPHVIVAGSLSKTFSMTGWRTGYALAPKPLAEAIAKLQSQSTSNPTSIAQYAALEALRGPMEPTRAMLAEYARRRARILEGVRALPGITCTEPHGAFYVFPDVAKYIGGAAPDSTALARLLLEREHLAAVPGDAFAAPGYLRFSYATSMERIEEGLRRFERFLRSLGPGS